MVSNFIIPSRETRFSQIYDHNHRYSIKDPKYAQSVLDYYNLMIGIDLGEKGSTTARSEFSPTDTGTLCISAKQAGRISGFTEYLFFLRVCYPYLRHELAEGIEDGCYVDGKVKEVPLLYINGNSIKLLEIERHSVDIPSRMSGTATEVYDCAKEIDGTGVKLAATRKIITPMDKTPFTVVDSYSHRPGVEYIMMSKDTDRALLRENFPELNDIGLLMKDIELCWRGRYKTDYLFKDINAEGFIAEVKNIEEAVEAAKKFRMLEWRLESDEEYFPVAILLDNFSPEEILETLSACKNSQDEHGHSLYDYVLFEASGIDIGNIRAYAETGVDVISIGHPTHSVDEFKMHMVGIDELFKEIDPRRKEKEIQFLKKHDMLPKYLH